MGLVRHCTGFAEGFAREDLKKELLMKTPDVCHSELALIIDKKSDLKELTYPNAVG